LQARQTNLKENPPKLRAFLLIVWGMNACFSVKGERCLFSHLTEPQSHAEQHCRGFIPRAAILGITMNYLQLRVEEQRAIFPALLGLLLRGALLADCFCVDTQLFPRLPLATFLHCRKD